ncbi:hypothetical protein J6500_21645 [Bradyrhizobium sp. WSM 1704]|nr:hypothetical protein [Bradyrhizobium semiaridum]
MLAPKPRHRGTCAIDRIVPAKKSERGGNEQRSPLQQHNQQKGRKSENET